MGIQMTEFSIRAVTNGSQCDLMLSGEIDLQVAQDLTRVARSHLADPGVQRLLVDLGGVSFLDSTGLGALVAIRNAANKQGKEMALGNVSDRISQLLGITGLGEVFSIDSDDAPTDPRLRIVPS